MLIADKNSLC
uniref:Uncharacterized protein n=1 Tax=Anguilla anguilla TaxID=7936 RepID=A0A0E9UKE3_ANGAN